MKIVIVGGRNKADFLVGSLLEKKHQLIVINEDAKYCEYLANMHDIPIIYGDPSKQYVLDEAGVHKADILIALTSKDADNLAICQMAKRAYEVKKVVCITSNPKNVRIFKMLGIHTVISATHMIAQYIEQASTIENLIQTLSLEDEKIIMSEILIDATYYSMNKKIKEIKFPKDTIISCIIRRARVIIPNGQTILNEGDKLIIISTPISQAEAIKAITGGK